TKLPYDHKTKKFPPPTPYHISGSANFYNKFDNHITVYRDFETQMVEIHINKVKFQHWGSVGTLYYAYDIPSGRYYSTEGKSNKSWLDGINFEPMKEQTRAESIKEGAEAMKEAAISKADLPSENPFEGYDLENNSNDGQPF
ncbi:MAG: hypothetical protein LC109_09365, partial [Bacteroidia bacterium]|nr:hypothetical protein [Bacteroidia bacterium]